MDDIDKLYYKLIMKFKKPKFSSRMILFSELAIENAPFWDFCCDHGYIGLNALTTNRFSEIHFVDQVPHIMERLQNLLKLAPTELTNKFSLHFCKGENINQVVYGNIIIAGVSGRTIVSILDNLHKKSLLKAERLLLSPHLDHVFMEEFLASHFTPDEIKIIDIVHVKEKNRLRPIYKVDLLSR